MDKLFTVGRQYQFNMVKHNPIVTRVYQINHSTYVMGFHAHNSANRASEIFSQLVGFDIEEVVVDWFEKSTEEKFS